MDEEAVNVTDGRNVDRKDSVESIDRVADDDGEKGDVESFHQVVQPYVTETELIKLLADERLRNSQHRLNYQDLKTMLLKLQREVETKDDTLRSLDVEIKQMQSSHEHELEQLRSNLRQKEADMIALQAQMPREYELELERIRITREAEEPLKMRIKQMTDDVEVARQKSVQLEYENSLLRGELEHTHKSSQRLVEETKLKYQIQMSLFDKEREESKSRQDILGEETEQAVQRLREEASASKQQMKALKADRDNILSQKQTLIEEKREREDLHLKQVTYLEETRNALQNENVQLGLKLQTSEKEINKQLELVGSLESQLSHVKGQLSLTENKLEELSYQQRREQANSKVETSRLITQANKEKDLLGTLVEDLKSRLETEGIRIQQLESLLASKEEEIQGRVEAARQNEQQKLHKLNMENTELQAKLQVSERNEREMEKDCERRVNTATAAASQASEGKALLERENLAFRDRLRALQDVEDELEKQKRINSSLRAEIPQLTKTIGDQEKELKAFKEELKSKEVELKDKLTDADACRTQLQEQLSKTIVEHKRETQQLEETLEKLRAEVEQNEDLLKKQKRKNHMYAKLIKKLRVKLENQQEQVELSSKHGWVPGHLLQESNDKLSKWKQKHDEFTHLLESLLSSNNPEGIMKQIGFLQEQLSRITINV